MLCWEIESWLTKKCGIGEKRLGAPALNTRSRASLMHNRIAVPACAMYITILENKTLLDTVCRYKTNGLGKTFLQVCSKNLFQFADIQSKFSASQNNCDSLKILTKQEFEI